MKKQIFKIIFLSTVFLSVSYSSVFAALNPLAPAKTPSNQSHNYQTDLFTGSADYVYPITVPKGTDDLTPNVSLSYNSLAVRDLTQRAGIGWQLSQDYVERDTKTSPGWVVGTADDTFRLHFKGTVYDLVYNDSDSRYHTKIESFFNIQKLTGGQNDKGDYWQVISPDGTKYRFGYQTQSELVCNGQNATYNQPRDYVAQWELDQIEDTHTNHIYYTYTEDNGNAYLSQIKYNNDQQREIDFAYTASPYQRQLVIHGCSVTEMSKLDNIQVKENTHLVHKYDIGYTQAANSQQLLTSIIEKGNDGTALPATTFDYKSEIKNWSNTLETWIDNADLDVNLENTDVVMADVTGDGMLDIVKSEGNGNNTWKVWRNMGNSWNITAEIWINNQPLDAKLDRADTRLIDVTGDGLPDIIKMNNDSGGLTYKVYRNTGSSWNTQPEYWINRNSNVPNITDAKVGLVDVDGDGRPEIVQSSLDNNRDTWYVYRNYGTSWSTSPEAWLNNIQIDAHLDQAFTKLIDINGDGLADIVKSAGDGLHVWKNTGDSWSKQEEIWLHNSSIITDLSSPSVVLADVNGDGLVDYLKSVELGSADKWQVLLNKGNDFSTQWENWIDTSSSLDLSLQANTQVADVNGDGLPDIVKGFGTGQGGRDTWQIWKNNGTSPNLLATVHTAQGATINFDYTSSAKFNNLGSDNLSDLPFNLWAVQKMTINNGLSNNQQTNDITTYTYKNGLYNWQQKEFRGFGEVDETDPNGSKKQTVFNQDDALKGTMSQTQITDASNNLYNKVTDTWGSSQSNGVYTVSLNQEKKYTYDGSATNPKVIETNYLYDTYGNLTKKSELGDTSITGDEKFSYNEYTYNPTAWIVTMLNHAYVKNTDDATKVSETWDYYDNNAGLSDAPTKGDLTKEVKWLNGGTNQQTQYAYDSYGNQTQVTDANNHTTTVTYGTNDTTSTYPDSTKNAKNQTTNTTYDLGTGNLLAKTDPNGFATTYGYDVFGRISKEIDPYDSSNFPTITYQYFDGATPQGTLVSKRKVSNAPATLDAYTFVDGFGRKVQTRTPSQDTTKQIVADTFYDATGQVSKQTIPHLDAITSGYATPVAGVRNTSTTYDPIGRILSITNPQGTAKTIAYNHWVETNTDENNHQTKNYRDAYTNILQVDELNGNQTQTTKYVYDPLNNLTKITDANSNNFTFTFDTLGRRITQTDPDVGTWHYTYDGVNNLITKTDNRNLATTRTYDELNRITKVDYPTDTDIASTYDGNNKIGTLTSVTDSAGTVTYSYDNRLRKTQEQRVMDERTSTTQFAYDDVNNITSRTNPDGETITYTFNPQNEVASVSGLINNSTYDALGHTTQKTFANSLTTNYTYNADDFRLNKIQTGTVQDQGYTYDAVGNVASITDNLLTKTQNFGYDSLNRVTTAQETNGYNYTYAYNPIGNLTAFTNAGNEIDYSYGQTAGVHALTSSTEVSPTPTPSTGGNISFRSASPGNNGAGSSSLTINKPTGTAIGDVLLAHVVVRVAGNTITAPSGWQLIQRKDSGSSISTATYYKVASSSEPTNYTWNFGTSGEASGGLASYINVNTTTPIDASTAQYNITTSTVSSPGVTTTTANDMLVLAVGITVPTTVNVPSGFNEAWSTTSSSSTTSEVSNEIDTNIGATGTINGSNNGGANSNITHLIALKPTNGGVATPTPTPTATPTNTPTPTPASGITLRAKTASNNGGGSTSLTINKPTGTATGDVLIAHVIVRVAGNTITSPSGWTQILRQDSTSSISTATYWKTAGSSEPTSYTWNFGTSGEASGGIASYTGVNTTSPIDANIAQYNSGTSTVSNPGVTTSVANDMLVFAVGITVPTTVNVPSGFTQEWTGTSSTSTTSEMSDKLFTTVGATGTISGSHNGGANSNITMAIALKPAGTSTDTLLSQGKSITASTQKTGYEATKANDGVIVGSYWEAADNTYPATLTVDLGATHAVDKIVMKLDWGTRIENIEILGSTDNSNFTTIVLAANYSLGTVPVTFTATNTRYLRLKVNSNNSAAAAQMAEFEVWGQ